jgi:hypothetical protein
MKKQQVPPLRCAPVGMTLLFEGRSLLREIREVRGRTADPSGGFGSNLLGQGLPKAEAGGKEGTLHLRFGDVE